MTSRSTGLLALTALLLPLPSFAATNLECMYDGYSAEDAAAIKDFSARYDLDSDQIWDDGEIVGELVAAHAVDCAIAHDWSPSAIEQAKYHQLVRLIETALEASPSLNPDDVRRLRSQGSSAEAIRLRKLFAERVRIVIDTGGDDLPDLTETEANLIAQIVTAAGIQPVEVRIQAAAALIIMQSIAQITQENFARE